MPESDDVLHYHHIQRIQTVFDEHLWSRQQTQYDSKFIAWLEKELQKVANEAYRITQGGY